MTSEGLYAHQAEIVPWLLARPRALLAWEMGVGKTAPLLRAWEQTRERGAALVLCLSTARLNWAREIRKFAWDQDFPPRVEIVPSHRHDMNLNADILLCNYDKLLNPLLVGRFRTAPRWGALILDEAHKLKTPTARRTRVVYGGSGTKINGNILRSPPLIDFAERVWLATGTPMPNHPGELYSHCRALWPEHIGYGGHVMEQWEFEAQYCQMQQTQFGMAVVGGRNLGELRQRLAPVVHVLKRKDVLDLPPLTVSTWPLGADTTAGGLRVPDLPGLLGTLEEKYGRLDEIECFDAKTLDAYLACIHGVLNPLATLCRETAQLKAVYTGLTISEELDAGGHKTVVFAYHREAISTLARILAPFKPALVHGDIPEDQRQAEIDRFQTDPACRVFIAQLSVAGASINLQAASRVVFVEASWCPGDNEQAIARVYRNGQENPVWVRFVFLPNSVDEAKSRAIARKSQMIQAVGF